MYVINLNGGPSVGKSTLAGDVAIRLKRLGVQAECPPEAAKLPAQRGDKVFLEDQMMLFAMTHHQLAMAARSGADVAVLDSPLLLSLAYMPTPYFATFPAMVREVYDSYRNIEYILRRDPNHGHSMVGRIHDEAQSIAKDRQIVQILEEQKLTYRTIDSSEFSAVCVVSDVMRLMGRATPDTRKPRALRAA
jgi:nicotinamide riboside kinase